MTPLQNFAQSILDYLENKGKKPDWFNPYFGLCFNWESYDEYDRQENYPMLSEIFSRHKMHDEYPFNKDFWSYSKEQDDGTLYKNPKRLAFLRKLAKGDLQ